MRIATYISFYFPPSLYPFSHWSHSLSLKWGGQQIRAFIKFHTFLDLFWGVSITWSTKRCVVSRAPLTKFLSYRKTDHTQNFVSADGSYWQQWWRIAHCSEQNLESHNHLSGIWSDPKGGHSGQPSLSVNVHFICSSVSSSSGVSEAMGFASYGSRSISLIRCLLNDWEMMISPPRGSAYRQSIKDSLWFLMQPPHGVFSLLTLFIFSILHTLSAFLSPYSSDLSCKLLKQQLPEY